MQVRNELERRRQPDESLGRPVAARSFHALRSIEGEEWVHGDALQTRADKSQPWTV